MNDWTAWILYVIHDAPTTRKRVATAYAAAMQHDFDGTDWKAVNHAIIEQWSMSGLQYIKKLAWKEALAA